MKKELICIVCPQGCRLSAEQTEDGWNITGNGCKRGERYGISEMAAPTRVLTSTVKLMGGRYPRLPVKTNGAIPKELILDCMAEINRVTVHAPVKLGQTVLSDILGTGVDVVAAKSVAENR